MQNYILYQNKLIVVIVSFMTLTMCSIAKEMAFDTPQINIMYLNAQQKLINSDWKQAIVQLKALHDGNYSLTPCSQQQIQLDLIYAYYKNSDLSSAQAVIDRFIRLNPAHPNIDYVIYMRGVINMALDNSNTILRNFFNINYVDLNPHHAYDAFDDFFNLIKVYPKSKYIDDAIKRLIFLKNRLAKYEYSVADYYQKRGAWIAVIHRIEGMLHNYQDTQATKDGLKLMENAYRHMQMLTQANKVSKIVAANSYLYKRD